MSADIDAPDKIVYGLTFRQLAILGVAAAGLYLLWQALHHLVPVQALVGVAVVVAGLAFGVAVSRRDGLSLDRWLLHGLRFTRAAKQLSTSEHPIPPPDWVQPPAKTRVPLPAPLRLPAQAIDDDGQIDLDGRRAAVVAASTINLALRTPGEQAALIDAWGRWLNSLSAPTQVVVSAQPVDLRGYARTLAEAADTLPHPALRAACADHAAFLADLADRRDPLQRQILITCATTPGEPGQHAARRRADDTVRALTGLGVATRVLDGAEVTAAVAATADPYRPARPARQATAHTVITGPTPAEGNAS
jgi:hypothetical protein